MAKYNQDLVMSAGNDLNLRFTVTNDSTGALIPMSDIVGVNFSVTPFEDNVTPLFEKTVLNGGVTIPEDGVVLVILNSSNTIDLSGEFSYELKLLDGGGNIVTAARGRITIKYYIAGLPQ